MGQTIAIYLRVIMGIMVMGVVLWGATAFMLSCDSYEPTIPWEDLDDDHDGWRNGQDLWPFNPELH